MPYVAIDLIDVFFFPKEYDMKRSHYLFEVYVVRHVVVIVASLPSVFLAV